MRQHNTNMIKEVVKRYILTKSKMHFDGNVASFEVETTKIIKVVKKLFDSEGLSLLLVTATDEKKAGGGFKIWYVFGVPKENIFIVPFIKLINTTEFPSITPLIHKAVNYERKIQTFFGLTPKGHPDTRPIILHENWPVDVFPLRKDFDWQTRPKISSGAYEFHKVEGEGIYEIPVGPIHAGIIEPGHFRFSMAGESIMRLEARLGYVHKGSEKLFEVLSLDNKIKLSEKISGDSSLSHSLAFCQSLENLANVEVPRRALYIRVIMAEMERLANHLGDIGAIMLDAGYNFGGASGARLREMIMQINERLTGSRFLRGVNILGGVTKDIEDSEKVNLINELTNIANDFAEVIEIAKNSGTLLNRLKGTGVLVEEFAREFGATGVAAKAVGMGVDGRVNFPYAAYKELEVCQIATEKNGDVHARFGVRIKEVRQSIEIIREALLKMPEGEINAAKQGNKFKKNSVAISVVEGWRGEIVYAVMTDAAGNISRVVPNDPSFINWEMVESAGPGNIVADFPLINKGFNMSYSGNDL
jgi:Ni,Fe-hydrogenase III large subunit/Ni,Fe-hydrogenase III component G